MNSDISLHKCLFLCDFIFQMPFTRRGLHRDTVALHCRSDATVFAAERAHTLLSVFSVFASPSHSVRVPRFFRRKQQNTSLAPISPDMAHVCSFPRDVSRLWARAQFGKLLQPGAAYAAQHSSSSVSVVAVRLSHGLSLFHFSFATDNSFRRVTCKWRWITAILRALLLVGCCFSRLLVLGVQLKPAGSRS